LDDSKKSKSLISDGIEELWAVTGEGGGEKAITLFIE